MFTERDLQNITTQVASLGDAFGKFKRALSTMLLPPTSPKTFIPDTIQTDLPATPPAKEKFSKKVGRPEDSSSACRICLRSFKPEDARTICTKCSLPICEDCSCNNTKSENGKPVDWKCTVCRRKLKPLPTSTRRLSRSLSDIPDELIDKVLSPHTSAVITWKGSFEGGGKSRPREMGQTKTMSAFPISGEFYYDVKNIRPPSSASLEVKPSDGYAEIRQQWPQQSKTSPFVSPWLAFGPDDLNAISRRLLTQAEDIVPDSPFLIRISIQRDVTDRSPTTRGLGMHVTGGRVGIFIYWVEPGGPAERAGVKEGDWIMEWNSILLIDRTFEEVMWVIAATEPIVNLTINRPPERMEQNITFDGSADTDSDRGDAPSTSTGGKLSNIPE